jgi:hypothetical protein
MSALNTGSSLPFKGRDGEGQINDLSLPTTPPPGNESNGRSSEPGENRKTLKHKKQHIIHVQVQDDSAVFVPQPDSHDPTKAVEAELWKHVSKLSPAVSHRVDFGDQIVQLRVKGITPYAEELRQRLAEISVTGLRAKIVDSILVIYQATTTDGRLIQLTPGSLTEESRQNAKSEQRAAERTREKVKRLLELKHSFVGILTQEEYDHVRAHGVYPMAASTKLGAYEGALIQLLGPELQKPEGRQWVDAMKRFVEVAATRLKSPYPYLDALLTLCDPQNGPYRAVALSQSFKQFLRDSANYGLFPSLSAQGKAKLTLHPLITKLL